MTLASPIVELRRYKLRPGARETLIELFEREFIESQEADGMTLIGQFREVSNSDVFTWLRGFPSMSVRPAALERFYSGPVWKAHAVEANATMLDVDDVLLLRPARPDSAFRLEGERAAIGSEESSSGVIEATILHLEDPPESNGVVSFFESAIAPTLDAAGGTVLGYFLTERSPNNYPGLPIREDANVLAYFTGFPQGRRLEDVAVDEAPGLARPPEVIVLEPTTRARLRANSPACPIPTKGVEMPHDPVVHRFPIQQDGAFVNAYLVETAAGVVAVDSLLTVSDSTAMRAALERLGKPLHAVLLTHSHPDHYAGLAQLLAGDEVPVIAPQGVIDTIVRDDPVKDAIIGPMFGDEWPKTRVFPNTPIADGESVTFDGVGFTVIDLGPSESPHDSPWILEGDVETVFLGDQIYDHRHCYLADGFHREWLANIERLRGRFADDTVFYVGHGGPVGSEMWDWQRGYIETFLGAVGDADWSEPEAAKAAVVARMKDYEPSEELQFLMELSIEPVAEQLGLPAAAR